MPTVRFLKVFKGTPKYKNPAELDDIEGLETIEVESFPHTEEDITAIALVKIDPFFYGKFRIRIPDTSADYYEIVLDNPGDKNLWAVIKNENTNIFLPEPGKYTIDLSLDGVPIQKTTLVAKIT